MKRSKYFVGSCILIGALLLKAGAPPLSIALGMAAAGLMHWRWRRRAF